MVTSTHTVFETIMEVLAVAEERFFLVCRPNQVSNNIAVLSLVLPEHPSLCDIESLTGLVGSIIQKNDYRSQAQNCGEPDVSKVG